MPGGSAEFCAFILTNSFGKVQSLQRHIGFECTEVQIVQVVHGVAAVLFVAVMLAHIYIGTIGMEGAFEGMWDGTVDANWAKEHHSLWLDEEMREGELAPDRHAAATAAE